VGSAYAPAVQRLARGALAVVLGLGAAAPSGCKERSRSAPHRAVNNGLSKLSEIDRSHPKAGVIVVLGSSTAEGQGATTPERSWVALYRAHLDREFVHFAVVSLAAGGQTTYHIQPSSYAPPPHRPAPVAGKNMDAALALSPSAILISLPSNDQAEGYSLEEQLANYDRLAAAAAAARVPLWVTTTQPRNFREPELREGLLAARQAILRRFSPRALDFWTPLADSAGLIRPELDSGDGTHIDDAGHALLARVVIEQHIPETVLAARN